MKQLSPEQVAKMRPEARERYEQRLKIVKRNRKTVGIVGAVFIIAAIVLALSLTVLFNITTINVSKKSAFYSEKEIVIASGLDIGDNLLRTDFDKVSQRIEQNLPYISEANISKTLSGAVTISVKDTTAAIIIESKQGYAIADINGKVLEIIKELPEALELMKVKTNCKLEAIPGEKFAFDEKTPNDNEKGINEKLYDSLIYELNNADMLKNITLIDISDRSSITLEYQNRLRLLLGANEQIDVKLKSAAEIIKAEDSKDPTAVAEVNLTIPKKVFVNPLDSLDDTEEAENTKDTVAPTENERESDVDSSNTSLSGENESSQAEDSTSKTDEKDEEITENSSGNAEE